METTITNCSYYINFIALQNGLRSMKKHWLAIGREKENRILEQFSGRNEIRDKVGSCTKFLQWYRDKILEIHVHFEDYKRVSILYGQIAIF